MSSDFDIPEGEDPELWEQKLAGEGAMHSLFVHVRKRFLELEKSEGFTQADLARRMGLTRTQISRWLASPSNMTLRAAGKLLCAMGRRLEFVSYDPYDEPLAVKVIKQRNVADTFAGVELVRRLDS